MVDCSSSTVQCSIVLPLRRKSVPISLLLVGMTFDSETVSCVGFFDVFVSEMVRFFGGRISYPAPKSEN